MEKSVIVVKKDLVSHLPNLLFDKCRLIQVVVNLIKNSYKSLDALKDDTTEKNFMLRSFSDKKEFCFEITDNGVGISAEDVETVFDFGRSSKESSGLGLYYCKTFIESNNGKIHISSPGRGKGATVRICFET